MDPLLDKQSLFVMGRVTLQNTGSETITNIHINFGDGDILLFNKELPIYLTLSERKEMKFPVLLGRKFLNNKFIIDTTKTNLSYRLKTK